MTSNSAEISAVLDTNLVVSAHMVTSGSPAQVVDAWRRREFILISSAELVVELVDVFGRPELERYYHVDRATRARLIADFADSFREPLPLSALPLHCRDPKDDKLLACALGAGAGYIVTGDKDLLDLDGEPALGGLRIVQPEEFLIVLRRAPR